MIEKNCCLTSGMIKYLEDNLKKKYTDYKCKGVFLKDFGGCLVARNQIKKGEEILRINESMFITLTTVQQEAPYLSILSQSPYLLQNKTILALFIASIISDPNNSHYNYLNSIPTSYTNIITWNQLQFNLLRNELKIKYLQKQNKILNELVIAKEYLSKQQIISQNICSNNSIMDNQMIQNDNYQKIQCQDQKQQCLDIQDQNNSSQNNNNNNNNSTDKISNNVEMEMENENDKPIMNSKSEENRIEEQTIKEQQSQEIINKYKYDYNDLTQEQFLNYIAMIESRTLFYKNKMDQSSEVGAMVPFYDLANHTFMEDIDHFKHFYYDQQDNCYVMKAYKDFDKEEQIFITYGNYNNEHYLNYYGFIPYENNREALQFTIETKELSNILGKEYLKQFKDNSHIAQNLLSHFFNSLCLKSTIVFEVEQSSQSFSWETNIFLQVFSLNLNNIPTTVVADPIKNKIQKGNITMKDKQTILKKKDNNNNNNQVKQQKQQKSSSEKSQLSQILEAFNSNSIENQSYFNNKLYLMFANNLKNYLLSLYKDIDLTINVNDNDYRTKLAKEFTLKEINIIQNIKL